MVEAGGNGNNSSNGGGGRMKQQRCYLQCCGQEIRACRLVESSQTVLLIHCRQKMVVFSKCVWQMIAISSLRLSFVITGICQTYPINCLLKIYCPIFNSFKYWLQPWPPFWFLEEHLHLILSKLNWSCFRHLSSLSFILQLLELVCIWSFYISIKYLQWP